MHFRPAPAHAPAAALLAALMALPCQALELEESLRWRPAAQALAAVDEVRLPTVAAAPGAGALEAGPGDPAAPAPARAEAAEPDTGTADTDRNAITDFLRAHLGAPYRLGATGGREGFDCSGLVLRAYAAAGLSVPRVSTQQLATGNAVPVQALKAGDLLFYRMRPGAPRQLHVAVYVGAGRAIHASVTHKVVREIDITRPLWSERLVAARSLL